MQFFEKPRHVTALVFFIQTILALLNMETFLYMHVFIIFVIPFFFGFPFAFYYVYRFILMDLDKEKETAMTKPVETVKADEFENHSKETHIPSANKQVVVQEVMNQIYEENQEPTRSTTPEKHIQVIHASDVFADEDAEPLNSQEQPILNPIVVKKDRTHRQKNSEPVSKETEKIDSHKTVEPASLPMADEPETEKEA